MEKYCKNFWVLSLTCVKSWLTAPEDIDTAENGAEEFKGFGLRARVLAGGDDDSNGRPREEYGLDCKCRKEALRVSQGELQELHPFAIVLAEEWRLVLESKLIVAVGEENDGAKSWIDEMQDQVLHSQDEGKHSGRQATACSKNFSLGNIILF